MNKSTLSTGHSIERILNIFVCAPICCLGIITGSISVFIFSSKDFKSEKLFEFYKFKSFFMLLNLCIKVLVPLYYLNSNTYELWQVVYNLYFKTYLSSPLEASSMSFGVLAVVYFYSKFSSKKKLENILLNLNNYILGICMFILYGAVFCFKVFEKDIKFTKKLNSSLKSYYLEQSYFSSTIFYKILEISSFIIRDFVFLSILIYFNFIIYFLLRSKIRNKKKLLKFSTLKVDLQIINEKSLEFRNIKSKLHLWLFLIVPILYLVEYLF